MHHPRKEVEDFNRFREILTILTEEGFGYILDKLNVARHVPLTKRVMNQKRETQPERLKETIERLGPTYIKFGQILSERPDILPERYCEELEKLEDSAPEFPSEQVKQIIEDEIGWDRIAEFEEKPLAAASISQVHRATLESGEEVVLKVRRPGIKKQVRKDLDIILYLAEKADKHVDLGENFLHGEAEEFAEWTKSEMDFQKELRNAMAFKRNMEDEEDVRVPDFYSDMCTEKVLTMEYIDAVKCNDVEKLREMDIDEKNVATTGLNAVLKQILRDGLLHADPHPSNFMVDQKGNMVFLDFGMMTRITKKDQKNLGFLMLQISNEDVDGLIDTIERISAVSENADSDKLKKEAEKEVLKLRNTTIEEQSVSKILISLSTKAAKNGFYVPTKITLIGKGILTMEGVGLKIYPDYSIQENMEEEVERLLLEQNDPKQIAKDASFDLMQNEDLVSKLPSKINELLDKSGESQKVTVENKSPEIELIPAAFILSSCALIAASIYSRVFLYIGLIELAYGIYLHHN